MIKKEKIITLLKQTNKITVYDMLDDGVFITSIKRWVNCTILVENSKHDKCISMDEYETHYPNHTLDINEANEYRTRLQLEWRR